LVPDDPNTLSIMDWLGSSYRNAGRLPEATDLLEQAWAKSRKLPTPPESLLNSISNNLGQAYEQAGQFTKAESLYRDAIGMLRRQEATPDSAQLQAPLAGNLLEQKRYSEAEPLLRDSLRFREQHESNGWSTFNTKSKLGVSLLGQKKYTEAEPLLLAGYE